MKKNRRQYTIRAVPDAVDQALRERARREGKSLNEVATEALQRGVGLIPSEQVSDDLDAFVGSWVDDPAAEDALKAQDRVDRSLWR
jgi:plasmid stability protein